MSTRAFDQSYVCASECLRPPDPRRAPQFLGPGGSAGQAVRSCWWPQHVTATFRSGLGWAWSPRPRTPRTGARVLASAAQRPGLGPGDTRKEQERGQLPPKLSLLGFSKWDEIREMWNKATNLRGFLGDRTISQHCCQPSWADLCSASPARDVVQTRTPRLEKYMISRRRLRNTVTVTFWSLGLRLPSERHLPPPPPLPPSPPPRGRKGGRLVQAEEL